MRYILLNEGDVIREGDEVYSIVIVKGQEIYSRRAEGMWLLVDSALAGLLHRKEGGDIIRRKVDTELESAYETLFKLQEERMAT